ncbi:hypothetical protein W97_09209 [Coniosporium apollinis CBS 100218]|uniref:MACPF domain-containing protein n=1 Tax=Coniosporium apollinis (strain CBS 100218) TaxID=1168221 RepID=R7Z7E4_CONA1|nr:uncharacterized protein W97_09209 [Coniosporium apollinis CBS 100218]EON69944.1 hypothetical protein W97_09209 [Coniosporium apollinis CBS 100218]
MDSASLDKIKDLEWPFRASLSKQAAGGTQLNLPWSARYIAPGTSFKSALVKAPEGPFLKPSPFDSKSLEEAAYVFEKNDLQGSFMEATSTSSGFNSEHLSVSLGITVGCSFLNASVSGRYDKSLLQNSDAYKTSQRASVRRGHLSFQKTPALSASALQTLETGGLAAFQEIYGDYYVAGINIGADSGVLVSQSLDTSLKTESLSVTVSVKVIFFTVSHTWTHDEREALRDFKFSVTGFSTMRDMHVELAAAAGASIFTMREAALRFAKINNTLDVIVDRALEKYGLTGSGVVDLDNFANICSSGLAVELVVLPYTSLRQVANFLS